jgi:hypothetical protein
MSEFATMNDLDKLRKEFIAGAGGVITPPKKKRELSKYNTFMKTEIARLKAIDPTIPSKKLFKQCAENWNKEKEPK